MGSLLVNGASHASLSLVGGDGPGELIHMNPIPGLNLSGSVPLKTKEGRKVASADERVDELPFNYIEPCWPITRWYPLMDGSLIGVSFSLSSSWSLWNK